MMIMVISSLVMSINFKFYLYLTTESQQGNESSRKSLRIFENFVVMFSSFLNQRTAKLLQHLENIMKYSIWFRKCTLIRSKK